MASFAIFGSVILALLFQGAFSERKCSYTSSSITCIQQSGKFLEIDASADINLIYITGCDLSAIRKEDFAKFTDVDNVHMSETELSFPMHNHLLSAIPDLHSLTIVNAKVTEEVGSVFVENHNILELKLMGNEISAIRNGFISHLRHVEDIDLSRNKITHIDVGAFNGLQSLKQLNLSYNRIGMNFDPDFLVYTPSKCAVCREPTIHQNCSIGDWNSCRKNDHYDQLWIISLVVSIDLNDNPICDIITGKSRPDNTIAKENSTNIDTNHQRLCKVYEKGHCFKHEGRRMFLLEACGLRKIPQSNTGPSTIDSRDMDPLGNVDREGKKEAGLFSTPLFWILMILALLAGVAATMGTVWYRMKKDRSRSRQNSSTEPDKTVKLPLIQAVDKRLHEAVTNGDLNKVKEILKSGANSNEIDANGDLPLHYAARSGDLNLVKEVLKGTNEINATNLNGHAAMHAAIARGHYNVVKYLLEHTADPNVKNKHGNSPLSQACKEGHTEIVRLLLDGGANIHLRNSFEEMPVHHAARRGRLEIFKLLHDKGADIYAIDSRGYTPLHYAAKKGNVEIARLILDNGESVNVRNINQNTPLHKAAKNGHLEMIVFLVERQTDVTATNFKGQKANDVAHEQNHIQCRKFLEDQLNMVATGGKVV